MRARAERSLVAVAVLLGMVAILVIGVLQTSAGRTPSAAAGPRAALAYVRHGVDTQRWEQLGTAAAIGIMLLAFLVVYQRSVVTRAEAERLAEENAELASLNEQEAMTDALTGLGNRRALLAALNQACTPTQSTPVMLALFDLDGFKQYNDVFGHPAGDALLQRLGERLSRGLPGGAIAYRMGGDEFCVLAPLRDADAISIAETAAAKLVDRGERFAVEASYGLAVSPTDTDAPAELLRIADQRMYANKMSRSRRAAGEQTIDVLEQVLAEQDGRLAAHSDGVAALAAETARRVGMSDIETRHVQLAARLHDVGKCAIPSGILEKPTALTEDDWKLVRQHTVVGERIVNAAPAISHVAPLIRSHHERVDGTGYPDGLSGEGIPLGARVIAVCDAFHAMSTDRVYRPAMTTDRALAELRACAGSQFDPAVVAAFITAIAETDGALRPE